MKSLADTIRAIRIAADMNQTQFGEALGVGQSTVTRWESGSVPKGEHLKAIANFANTTVERLLGSETLSSTPGNQIPVVGYVGAGAAVFPYDDFARGDGIAHIDRPSFVRGQVVAVEVQGDSLLPTAENGWRLIYAGNQTLDEGQVLNRLCVVKLADERMMVKRVTRGTEPGRYHLVSTNAPMIEDVQIEWAAPVTAIIPA